MLAVFFGFGAVIATTTAGLLLFPGSALDVIWRLNPQAHASFLAMGGWSLALMAVVATACALAAVGVWRRKRWGHRLATASLAINLLGDVGNAVLRHDLRTLIGIPIAGGLIIYLLSANVRRVLDQ